jgi:hypothetical protein
MFVAQELGIFLELVGVESLSKAVCEELIPLVHRRDIEFNYIMT